MKVGLYEMLEYIWVRLLNVTQQDSNEYGEKQWECVGLLESGKNVGKQSEIALIWGDYVLLYHFYVLN